MKTTTKTTTTTWTVTAVYADRTIVNRDVPESVKMDLRDRHYDNGAVSVGFRRQK